MHAFWNLVINGDSAVSSWLSFLLSSITVTTALLVAGPVMMMLFTWIERRGIAYMQDRRGPNRVGPFGLLQPVSEAIKTITKEDITPDGADRWIHFLAPVVVMFSTIMTFAVVPWGNLFPVDINVGVLFVIAVGSLHTLGMLMAGWGSNNKFALLGGMRAAAQMISYEIPQVMSLVAIVMIVGSMSVRDIALNQVNGFDNILSWHVFTPVGFLAFALFWVSSLAEGERTPFDIPEADSEIVAGYMTEYSGMKFAVFFLANYMTNLAICAVAAGVFLGGGAGPFSTVETLGLGTLISIFYFLAKTIGLFFVMVWIRGTFPRLRVDQLMSFAWKFLLPLALVNIFTTSIYVAIVQWTAEQGVGIVDALGDPGSVVRYAVAWVVTAVINVVAFAVVLRLNNSRNLASYQPTPTAA